MLDLVPLAGAWRQMADGDRKSERVGQRLKLDFPQPDPIAGAAATIGRDHQLGRLRMTFPPMVSTSGGSHERRSLGVVIGADTDPAQIVGDS